MKKQMEKLLKKLYKHERLFGRGEEYAKLIINGDIEDIEKNNYAVVSKFESITGEGIAIYPQNGKLTFCKYQDYYHKHLEIKNKRGI